MVQRLACVSVVLSACLAVSCGVRAEQTPADSAPRTTVADPRFGDAMAAGRAALEPRLRVHPAIAVAVAVDGQLAWSEARGWADVERRVPATPATRFRVYSVFKPVTAALALKLAAAGRVDLGRPIGEYMGNLPPATAAVTTTQLVTHTAGIRHYRSGEWMRVSRTGCARAADGLPPFARDALLFVPGTRSEYSSFGYVLASAVLEAAAGRPLAALMAGEILDPLGMTGAVPDDPATADPQAATPYESEGRRRPSVGINNTCKAGAGGFRAPAEDLARFGMALLSGSGLPAGTLDRFMTPAAISTGVVSTMGFGMGLANAEGLGRILIQSGGAIGGRAYLLVAPDHRIVVALASNYEGESFGREAVAIARAFALVTR